MLHALRGGLEGAGVEAIARKTSAGRRRIQRARARNLDEERAGESKRILVVDDHIDARLVMEEFLTANGFDVSVAKDGREALALIRGGIRYDLVVLDLMMPRVDGFEFLRTLQRLPRDAAKIPVVVVSAVAPPTVRGTAATFRKPAPLAELLATVEKLVGPGSTPAPSQN